MYQGENAKYIIDLYDENGNVIDSNSVENILVLIYSERTSEIVIEREYISGDATNSTIELDSTSFKFVVNSSDTNTLNEGKYRVTITISVSDADFDDGLYKNKEDSIIFEIWPTIKK